MRDFVGPLILIAIVAYVPLARYAVARFYRFMSGRRWLFKHGVIYATLMSLLFTPGCLAIDLVHGNSLPLPMPAWLALANGSVWGGVLPLLVGWVIAYSHVQSRVTPRWQVDAQRPQDGDDG